MTFEGLDDDIRDIISAMCEHTGKSKEEAISALVEIATIAMIASVSPNRETVIQEVYDAVNENEKLKHTAEIYQNIWGF